MVEDWKIQKIQFSLEDVIKDDMTLSVGALSFSWTSTYNLEELITEIAHITGDIYAFRIARKL